MLALAAFATVGCIGCKSTAQGAPASAPPREPESAVAPMDAPSAGASRDTAWGRFYSRRFELSFGLPDGAHWAIDDHTTPWLAAHHDGTRSTLVVRSWNEDELATRASCYARARSWDHALPDLDAQPLVDDRVRTLAGAIDARVAVGVVPGKASDLVGFAAAAGASIRRCLVLVFRTTVDKSETGVTDVVAGRLATATEEVFASLKLADSLAAPHEAPASHLLLGGSLRGREAGPSPAGGGLP